MKLLTTNSCRDFLTALLSIRSASSLVASLGLGMTFLHLSSCAPLPSELSAAPAPAFGGQTNEITNSASVVEKTRTVKTAQVPIERPGLGTGWGKDIASQIDYTSFQRASETPYSVDTIYYNDKEGIKAMTSSWTYRGAGMQKAAKGLVEWGVKGTWGYLKNQHSKGKRFVTGNKNKTYALVVKNLSHSRLEIVMSVDGLDVIDGKPASIKRRGYIIPAGKTLTVEGFRKSEDAVAAFKFSSVNSSYSQVSGSGSRNVGVIGMAVFTQKGRDPWKYNASELKQRDNARAFAEAPQLRAR